MPRTKAENHPKKKPKNFELNPNLTIDQVKEEKIRAETLDKIYTAKIKELKFKESNKQLIDVKIVGDIVTSVFTKLKSILYSSTNSIPAAIAGKESSEVTTIIYQFIDHSLETCLNDFDKEIQEINPSPTVEEQ